MRKLTKIAYKHEESGYVWGKHELSPLGPDDVLLWDYDGGDGRQARIVLTKNGDGGFGILMPMTDEYARATNPPLTRDDIRKIGERLIEAARG